MMSKVSAPRLPFALACTPGQLDTLAASRLDDGQGSTNRGASRPGVAGGAVQQAPEAASWHPQGPSQPAAGQRDPGAFREGLRETRGERSSSDGGAGPSRADLSSLAIHPYLGTLRRLVSTANENTQSCPSAPMSEADA